MPIARSNKSAVLLLGALAIVALGIIATSQAQRAPEPAVAQQLVRTPPPPPPHVIEIALQSDLDVGAGEIEKFEWNVPTSQPHCHLTGHLEVVSGGNKDVQVFVLRSDEFKNLSNGHDFRSFLSTEKTTAVTLDLRTSAPGAMILAVSNKFSGFTGKRVEFRNVQASCT